MCCYSCFFEFHLNTYTKEISSCIHYLLLEVLKETKTILLKIFQNCFLFKVFLSVFANCLLKKYKNANKSKIFFRRGEDKWIVKEYCTKVV